MQTQIDFLAIMIFLLFAGFGLFVLLAPVNLLSLSNRRSGKKILEGIGEHEVYMSSEGVSVALIRFYVRE